MALQLVRIETVPQPWMETYAGHEYPATKTHKTEKGITAVEVQTPDGPLWFAAKHLRRVEEEAVA